MSDAIIKVLAWSFGALIVTFLLSYPFMILWNECLVPAVPAIKEVSWMQMWGLSFLFKQIFT